MSVLVAGNWPGGNCDDSNVAGGTWDKLGQTFTTGSGGPFAITTIDLPLADASAFIPAGIITVQVFAVDGSGFPTGSALSTGTVDCSAAGPSVPPLDPDTVKFTVTMSAASLSSSTMYIIVVSPNVGAGEGVRWFGLNTNSYSGGTPKRRKVADGLWENDSALGDYTFQVWATDTMTKPTTPSPANSTNPGTDFSSLTFSWVQGGTGTVTFNFYMGTTGSLTFITNRPVATPNYTTTLNELQSTFGATPINQKIYWRVDATDGVTTVTGDEWVFDPRPAKVTTPSPVDTAINQRLFPTYGWTASALADTYNLTVTVTGFDPLTISSIATNSYVSAVVNFEAGQLFGYNTLYTWHIDPVNEFGTTIGDNWTLTTVTFDPPISNWANLAGKTLGPLSSPTPGVEGTDYRWLGTNLINTVKYFLVAKDSSIYYAEVF